MNTDIFSTPRTSKSIRRILRGCGALLGAAALVTAVSPVAVQAQGKPAKKPSPSPIGGVLWPLAPVSDPVLMKLRPDNKPTLQIEAPQTQTPPYEMLEDIAGMTSPLRGRLYYMARLPHLPGNQQYFIFRGVGITGMVNEVESNAAFYPVEVGATEFFDPLFSADGKRIMFKGGDPFERTGYFRLYMWDMAAARFYPVLPYTEVISYNEVLWSPDNNYSAYVRGGDMAGQEGRDLKSVHLRILDLQKGKSRRVVKNRGVISMAWTHQGTLLFTMVPQKHVEETDDPDDAADAAQPEPEAPVETSIYEVPAKGGAAKLVIRNGADPQPSPNGRWIAFLRPQPLLPGVVRAPVPQELWLYDRQQNKITRAQVNEVNFVRWTPDSRQIVVIKTAYSGVTTGGAKGEAFISLLNPATLATRDVTTLEAHDYRPVMGRNITSSQFRPMKFTRDGRFLLVSVSEFVGLDNSTPHYTERMTLQAVPLSAGIAFPLARILNKWGSVMGWDWYDETGTSSSVSTSSVSSSPRRPRENTGSTGSTNSKRNGGR